MLRTTYKYLLTDMLCSINTGPAPFNRIKDLNV